MKKFFGIVLMIIGVLGSILPVIPGFIFFFWGLALVSPKFSKIAKNIVRRYRIHRNSKRLMKDVVKTVTNKKEFI